MDAYKQILEFLINQGFLVDSIKHDESGLLLSFIKGGEKYRLFLVEEKRLELPKHVEHVNYEY